MNNPSGESNVLWEHDEAQVSASISALPTFSQDGTSETGDTVGYLAAEVVLF